MKRIGLLTSGGDCQGLNPALRGVAKSLYEAYDEIEIYGILDGYRGLIHREFRLMAPEDFSGILTLGGTILGTSRQPFKKMRVIDDNSVDKVKAMKETYSAMNLDALVILGGNGTHKTANLLREEGLNVVTLPKTIDNDIWNTDMTFGFQSAVNVATTVVDCIHTTATSHGRIFVIELMGHKAGWLTLYAGLGGGADVILLPEIPYHLPSVMRTLSQRIADGKRFSIIVVAEGAISVEDAQLPKKQYKAKQAQLPFPSVSYHLAHQLEEETGQEIRVCIPGHIQRGGSPCPYDRVLSTRFGAAAASLIVEQKYGFMVALKGNDIVPIPLEEVAGRLKTVPVDHEMITAGRDLGICFGD